MEKSILDLSVKSNADHSTNKTAMIGIFIMNAVLAIAYAMEFVKGARSPLSYVVVLTLCIVPCILAMLYYAKKKDSQFIRYILGIGFVLLYAYVMFTTTNTLTFCYIIVAFVMLVVYIDIRFLLRLAVTALVINIINVIINATSKGLSPEEITNTEIIFACLILTFLFVVMAVRKISKINDANVCKAKFEKEQSEELLQTTLEVASAISDDIANVVVETEHLKEAIGHTSHAMNDLTNGANDASAAMEEQASSTVRIGGYIQSVESSTQNILKESKDAQSNLEIGSKTMEELMRQVKTSEETGVLVTEKVTGLKEYADRMQEIMGLITNVAHQTGLLALNASIEAARAGEAGRGFGVVASEISNLSDQTNAAAGDITELIRNIVKSIEEAANAMSLLLESSQVQNKHVGETAANFEKIYNSTKGIISEVTNLKYAVDEVTSENHRIEEQIGHVSSITEEVTARSEETYEACNLNLLSIESVAAIMENLKKEAGKLQQEG